MYLASAFFSRIYFERSSGIVCPRSLLVVKGVSGHQDSLEYMMDSRLKMTRPGPEVESTLSFSYLSI